MKDKRGITITTSFQKIFDEIITKQTKYGQIKAVNFIIDQLNYGKKKRHGNVFNT